jgi:hypothetical protein
MKKSMQHNSQLYDWDLEPVDERPSEFMESTGYAILSGYHPMNDPARRERPSRGVGIKTMLLFCVVVIALGGFALVKMAALLRG